VGHYCRICGRSRPNERFSGHGHKIHVCKECARLPKERREAIEQQDAIYGFLHQSHLSAKNVASLKKWMQSSSPEVAELAHIVLEVGQVKPYRKRRLKVLARERPDLLRELEETCLIFPITSDGSEEPLPILNEEWHAHQGDHSNPMD
jgi:ribosome-binding protein aMBF1 (putative translation factor)